MEDTYVAIMIQSLKKKYAVLDEIARYNDLQKDNLQSMEGSEEQFSEYVEKKSKLIEQMEQLDSGFEKLYAQVSEELDGNREKYAGDIKQMQDLIRKITDKSVLIQAQEARNKELMKDKFSTVKRQAQNVRVNSKAITGYYKTLDTTPYLDPKFSTTSGRRRKK